MNDFEADVFAEQERPKWDAVAGGWNRWWAAFESGAQSVNDSLVELAGVRPGHAVLDIATGLGEPALTAARVAGADGSVAAFDLSADMLAYAAERARHHRVTNLEFAAQNAEHLDVGERWFDSAVCRWGLMLMGQPVVAARRVFDVLKPGARFATAVWDVPGRVPFLATAGRVVREQFDVPAPDPAEPGPFRLADPDALPAVLREAGFVNVDVRAETVVFEFDSAEVYAAFVCDLSHSAGRRLRDAEPEARDRAMRAIVDAATAFATPEGAVRFENVALCAVGEKP